MLTSLRAILQGAARTLGLERAAYTALIEELWPEMVGKEAAEHSRPTGLRGGVLLAEVEAGPWAQELSAQRARLASAINRHLGAEAVTEIRFRQVGTWAGPARRTTPGAEGAPAEPEVDAAERAAVERAAEKIADPEIREAVRRAMLSQARWRRRHVRPPGG